MNFEDEDFDFPEGFLDEVLPPSRSASHPTAGGWAVPAAPAPSASRADHQEDAGGFSCTPDSVSVSQMFGLRPGGGAAFPSRPGAAPAASRPAPAPAARAPPAPAAAAPASPGMSTADPFADDDLMDADLLDACEAAEAVPAAARLPAAEDGRSESRDVRTGDDPGQRDMLDDIGELSREAANRSAAAKSPSRNENGNDTPARRHDTSSTNHRPRDSFSAHGSRDSLLGGGSRDSPLGRAAFSGGGSRDTPSGARTGGRRSTGSAVKRRFPGPAGILPITGSLLTLAHEISLQDDDPVAGGEDDDPTLHDHVTESQLSQPEEASAWESGAWHRLLSELRLSPGDTDGLPRRINLAAIRRAAAANQLRKVPLLAALLHSLEPTSDLSYQATFRDPTGQMEGTVAKDAFEHCGAALRPGCALLLRDVVVWRESARRLYLSVTRRSLVCLAPETGAGAGSGDPAPVLRLSELDAAELASARLVEEPPEQPVLQESPPPSPPRQHLYSSPQLPTGARGGGGGSGGSVRGGSGGGSSGGGGWRGRGGRSWRGRGAGGSSGGRPAPYAANARRVGANGSPASRPSGAAGSASPALRTPPTASTPVNGAGSGLRAGPAAAASPALRLFPRPAATAPVSAPSPAPAPARPVVPPPASVKHKSDGISEAEIDAMFDDDDDVLFGQL